MTAPLFYNPFHSDAVAQNSIIGPTGTITGTASYSAVKHDNGGRVANSAGYFLFTGVDIGLDYGCIEFWCKFPEVPASTPAQYLFGKNGSPTSFIWWEVTGANFLVKFVPNLTNQFTMTKTIGDWTGGGANEVHHLALVWDMDLGPDWDDRVFTYVNGTPTGTLDLTEVGSPTPAMMKSAVVNDLQVSNNTASKASTIYINNLKYFNYTKTDFSDRFQKRAGLNDQIVNH